MRDNDKAKKILKTTEKKIVCELIGHDERVYPTEDVEGNLKYEIHCKRCKCFINDIKSFYDD